MRYFTYKPPFFQNAESQEIKVDYKELLKGLLKAGTGHGNALVGLDFEQIVRATELFKKIDALLPGDGIMIDDADYDILLIKHPFFVASLTPVIIVCPAVVDFLKYVKDLPKDAEKQNVN